MSKHSTLPFISYLKGVARESKLISWPPYQQVAFQFIIVVVLSSLLTGLLYLIDLTLMSGIKELKELFIK